MTTTVANQQPRINLANGGSQLETARRQLESARQQPQIQLVQRAMAGTSDHLRILIEKPYLSPYFYDNKAWIEGDSASRNEVKAMGELVLNNFASAIIHSAVFPQYPVRGVQDDQVSSASGAPPCGISLWKASTGST
jgi:hypothetical protein